MHRVFAMKNIDSIFGNKKKSIIGMVHFPPLPGSPLYDDRQKGIDFIERVVREDLIALQNGGIDAVLFCNENDRPYQIKADYGSIAVMSKVIGKLEDHINVPFGVNVLWDPKASLAVAKATGAIFIREIVSGAYISDMGIWNTNVGEVYRYKRLIEAQEIAVFFNICAEFASRLDSRPLEVIAKSVSFSSLADVILISGPMTGVAPPKELIRKVKANVDVPVFINTGLRAETVDELLEVADGAIIGTSLKKGGITWNQVEESRVREFMQKVEQHRN